VNGTRKVQNIVIWTDAFRFDYAEESKQ